MSTLYVDAEKAGTRILVIPDDDQVAPSTIVVLAFDRVVAEIEALVERVSVDRVIVDVIGYGMTLYNQLRVSWTFASRDIALSPVNFAQGAVVV